MLKIFSSQEFLPQGVYPAPILYPFWPELYQRQLYGWKSPYDEYVEHPPCFELTTLEQADVAILPFDWKEIRGDSWRNPINLQAKQLADRFIDQGVSHGKTVALFFGSDCSDEKIKIQGIKIFRQSAYQSRKYSAQDPMFPFFCEDFIQEYCQGELRIRPKRSRPTVGFCGFARPMNLKRQAQTLAYKAYMLLKQKQLYDSPYKGEQLRVASLKTLSQAEQIEPDFMIRDRSVFFMAQDYDDKHRFRLQYVENILNSDYVLCCRGSGNYSNRFYEVLSCGRIPIFINTDCRLPWEGLINWKDYCIWIEENELDSIAEKVAEFHAHLSEDDFIRMQLRCRQLWLEWLSPQGFFSRFHHFFSDELERNCDRPSSDSASALTPLG